MIEMLYHLQIDTALGPVMRFAGLELDASGPGAWTGAAAVMLAGAAVFEVLRRRVRVRWDDAQAAIEQEVRRREGGLAAGPTPASPPADAGARPEARPLEGAP
jgi:branched-chain amino acid transport system permease protein